MKRADDWLTVLLSAASLCAAGCPHSVFVLPTTQEATQDAFCETLLGIEGMKATAAADSIQVTTGLTWAASATTGVSAPIVVSGTLTGTAATQVQTTIKLGERERPALVAFCRDRHTTKHAAPVAPEAAQRSIRYDATTNTYTECRGADCLK